MNKFLLNTLLLLLSLSVLSQSKIDRCSTMEVDATLRANNPQIGTLEDFEEWLAPKVQEYKNSVQSGNAKKMVYNIPVIIHIIHNSNESVGSGRNISNAQAVSQIKVLNEDFRKLNADFSTTPSVFQAVAADCEINFCLASEDPNGIDLDEEGIVRIDASTLSGVGNTSGGYDKPTIESSIKPVTQWDPSKYMNVWVMELSGGSLGYAQFPQSSGLSGLTGGTTTANTDGVVITYNAFGNTGTLNPQYPLGRTATHEVGHFLGLKHIWGDDSPQSIQNGTCDSGECDGDDFVDDTPDACEPNYGCKTYPHNAFNSCGTDSDGEMFVNYMDYGNDACLTMFTNDQKARMMAVMQNSPRRAELSSSSVCGSCQANKVVSDQNFSDTDTPILYEDDFGTPPWGWISGHNSFGDDAKCEQFEGWVSGVEYEVLTLFGVEIYFAKAYDATGSSTVRVSVWNDNGSFNSEPTTLITSEDFPISQITTGNPEVVDPTYISFSNPPSWYPLNGDKYYVGIELSYGVNQDSVAIYTNTDDPSNNQTSWEKWSDGTWHQMYAQDSWGKNVNFLIMPDLCTQIVGVQENDNVNNDINVYPNPTTGLINIEFENGEFLEVYNLLGEVVLNETIAADQFLVSLDLTDNPNGVYFVSIKTNDKIFTKKILLSK